MGNGNKVEFLVAICALLTSIVAIWVAWDQSRVMRAQQHGMVFPVLQVDGFVSTQNNTISMGLSLSNTGVGPALIQSVTATVAGTPLASLEAYRESIAPGFDISWAGAAGRSLAPGSNFDALRLTWDREDITQDQIRATLADWEEIDFEFCYCSVFEKCWTVEVGVSRPQPVKACPLQTIDLFNEFGEGSVMSPPLPQDEAPQ